MRPWSSPLETNPFLLTPMIRKSSMSLVFGLGFGVLVAAQGNSPMAQCSPGFDWSFNSLNQSPCEMASYLGGACVGAFGIPPLPTTDSVYNGVPLGQNNTCRCSSVFYSVLSACADCQGRQWRNWAQFTENCTDTFVSSFPRDIPSGTSIPSWAYLNVTNTGGTFDATLAENQPDAPESTGISPSTSTSVPATSSSPASATETASVSSKKKIGPIVGGVIGGVVGLCLIVIFIVWLLRRRKNNTPPSGLVLDDIDPPPSQATLHPGYMQEVPNKLYDPTDPSTFPPSIPPQPVSPPRSPPPGSFMSSPPPTNTRDARWSYISAAPTTQISLHPNRFTGNPEL